MHTSVDWRPQFEMRIIESILDELDAKITTISSY